MTDLIDPPPALRVPVVRLGGGTAQTDQLENLGLTEEESEFGQQVSAHVNSASPTDPLTKFRDAAKRSKPPARSTCLAVGAEEIVVGKLKPSPDSHEARFRLSSCSDHLSEFETKSSPMQQHPDRFRREASAGGGPRSGCWRCPTAVVLNSLGFSALGCSVDAIWR